jgi:hypothetical protein
VCVDRWVVDGKGGPQPGTGCASDECVSCVVSSSGAFSPDLRFFCASLPFLPPPQQPPSLSSELLPKLFGARVGIGALKQSKNEKGKGKRAENG